MFDFYCLFLITSCFNGCESGLILAGSKVDTAHLAKTIQPAWALWLQITRATGDPSDGLNSAQSFEWPLNCRTGRPGACLPR